MSIKSVGADLCVCPDKPVHKHPLVSIKSVGADLCVCPDKPVHKHPLVNIKQVVIKCHLWDLISKRHPSSYGIDTITVISPKFYFSRSKDGIWNTEGIFKKGKPEHKPHSPPEFSLFAKGGRIIFQDCLYGTTTKDATSTVLSKINVSYTAGRFKARALSGSIQSESLSPLHCSGIIHAVSPVDMSWDIGMKKANLSRYSPYLSLPFGQVLDGDVCVNLKGRATCFETSTNSACAGTETPTGTQTKLPPTSQNRKEIKIGRYTIYGLFGQIGVQDGRFLLKNAQLPFNQINGVFKLTSTVGAGSKPTPFVLPITTLKVDNLRAVLCDTEVKTAFVVSDVNNPETLIQLETSRFNASTLKYLTNIVGLRNYFSRLKLKTSLKFSGRITPSCSKGTYSLVDSGDDSSKGVTPLTISGRLKTNNLLGKRQFLAEAGFVFRDDAFDSIDIDIDKKTKIQGRVSLSSSSSASPSDLVIECHQAKIFPLLGLAEIKETAELKNGNISGRLRIRPDNYEGNLTLDTCGTFQGAVLALKGQTVAATITQTQGGSVVASCQWSPFLRVDASVRDFVWNHSGYSFDALWDTNEHVGAGSKPASYEQAGDMKIKNVVINHAAYPPWHGRLSYEGRSLQIYSPQSQSLLINGRIRMDQADINIGFAGLRLDILHPALDGTADGRIQIAGNPFKRLTISGEGIDIIDNSLLRGGSPSVSSHATANFSITKRKNIISISSLSLVQPPTSGGGSPSGGESHFGGESLSVGGRAYISGFVTTSDRGLSSVNLNTRITNLIVGSVRATATAKYSGKISPNSFHGNIVLAKGDIGGLNISSGRIEINSKKNGNTFSGNICVGDKGMFACSGELNGNSITGGFTLNGMNFNELPWDYFKEWHGSAVLQGKIEGQMQKPCLSAKFTSSNLNISGGDVKNLSGSLYYASRLLLVDANFDNELFFSGMLGEETKARIKIEKGRLSLLSRVLKLPPVRLNGLINGELSLTGKMDNPCIEGDVTVKGFESHGVSADLIKVKVNIKDKVFSTSQLYCQQDENNQLVINKCMVELVPDGRISFEAMANSFQVANITLSGTISCNGNVTVGKSANVLVNTSNIVVNDSYDLKNLAVLVKLLNDESIEFIQQPAENSIMGKIRFASKDKVVIDGFSLLRQGRKILEITGWVNLATKKIDVGIIMDKADLALLSLYIPTIKKAKGVVNGGLHFGGLMNDPEIDGSLKFSGALNTYPFAARVRDMDGAIHIVNNSIIIQNLSANIGKGRLIAASEGAFTLSDMNISILTQGYPIPILVPEFIESHGRYGGFELNANISGAISSPLITGQIAFSNTDFTYPPKKTKTTPVSFFDKMRWDVMIIGKDNIRYYNDYARICLKKNAWLRVVKDDEQFNVTGKIFAREGGPIDYLGTEFILKEGCLEFREGNELSPYLSAAAWARVDKRKIILIHQGYLCKTEFVLSATGYPPLTQEEIIRLLISRGGEYATLNQDDLQTLFSVAGGQILGKKIPDTILVPIERRISRLLRIDLEVKTPAIEKMLEQAIFAEGTSTASSVFAKTSIKIGKFIHENLYISYKGVLNPVINEEEAAIQSSRMRLENEIGLEYYLSRNTTIKYKFIPRYNQSKAEYEVSMERGLRF
ncbi:translocation/assembly module TamB domain-containing protein [bacterium]|nr:translocation/assembly module TamB domain-containing protein [bacterium]